MMCIPKRLSGVLLALAITIFPTVSLAAGAGTSSSESTLTKSESSRYGKSTKGRFQQAKSLINQENFSAAYLLLTELSVKIKDEADRQNLLGFTARNYGRLDKAASHYKRALEINPKHRGALEYQGELFLKLGQIEKAKNNLELLRSQCRFGCSEVTQLESAINKF